MHDSLALRMLVATVCAAALVVSLPPRAQADHRPSTHCSDTGDICQSTTKVDGVRKLQVRTAANYFDRYRLCVRPLDGEQTCKTFTMHERDNGIWVGSVRWAKHFPDEGRGGYVVVWKLTSGDRIGRKLGFHAP